MKFFSKKIAVGIATLLLGATTVITSGTAVFAAEQTPTTATAIPSNENISEDDLANAFSEMFADGVSQENLNAYAQAHFSEQDLQIADHELNTGLSQSSQLYRVNWSSLGKCVLNKIKDEFFATINVSVIVKYAQKKAWKELAKIVFTAVKGAGIKTSVILIAGQLAVWAVQCGINF